MNSEFSQNIIKYKEAIKLNKQLNYNFEQYSISLNKSKLAL